MAAAIVLLSTGLFLMHPCGKLLSWHDYENEGRLERRDLVTKAPTIGLIVLFN